jgi:predicted GNAT family acetyltransferase
MTTDVLARPVWDALAHVQASSSVGDDGARRFAPELGPLAASRDDSPESLRSLGALVPADGTLVLLQADPIALPPNTVAVTTAPAVQMIAAHLVDHPCDGPPIERLTAADVPAMIELAAVTKPGPFAPRTASLGEFWGIKERGVLVAMAGERMRHTGYTELSAVCTHPAARGRGYGRALSAWVASRIAARGETPYLQAYVSNTVAIEVYRSVGFAVHRLVNIAAIARAAR